MKRVLSLVLSLSLLGCGNLGVDDSVIRQAKADASKPGLTSRQKAKIYEDAGDALALTVRRGWAADMYFNAANEYDSSPSSAGDNDVRRVDRKCAGAGIQDPSCESIRKLIMADWPPARRNPGTSASASAPQPARSVNSGGNFAQAQSPAQSNAISGQLDQAIADARRAKAGVPPTIDGCQTGVEHLAPRLAICRDNSDLVKLRELILLTDASLRTDQAAGLSLREVATRTAQAARQYDDALKQDENAMLETAADRTRASQRIAALRSSAPTCDAGPRGAFGMQESAFQAYVASYYAAQMNRAVSAIAACRARTGK